MSADPTTVIAALGVEPTYSAQEAAGTVTLVSVWRRAS